MSLLDFITGGGGDNSGAGGLYDGLLNDAQKQAVQQRGLLGFLGGLQKSGALDYTAPFLSGKVPAGFAAGLAGGAGGMGEAQDAAGMNALKAMLVGLQGQQLKANLAAMAQESDVAKGLLGGGGAAPNTNGPNAGPLGTPAAPGAAAAPASGGGGAGGWGPLADPAIDALTKSGLSTAAVQGVMANGLGEGGFNDPWKKAGGGENSFGHWQFNQGGELPGYLAWAKDKGDPKDTALQAQYVAQRMNQLVPGFSQITDPKLATDLVALKFEKYRDAAPGQRYGYLADVQQAMSGKPLAARQPIPAAPGQMADGALPAVPNFAGMMTGNQGAPYAPAAPQGLLAGPDTVVPPAGAPPQGILQTSSGGQVGLPDIATLAGRARQPVPGPGAGVVGSGYAGPPTGAPAATPAQLIAASMAAQQANGQSQRPMMPPPQGILPQPAAAPPSSQFAQVTGTAPLTPSPAPAPSAGGPAAASPNLVAGLNPQAAQALAYLRTMRGAPVPDFVNKLAGMPFVGPTAAAERNAQNQSDAFYKPPTEGAIEAAKNPALNAREQFKADLDLRNKRNGFENVRGVGLVDLSQLNNPGGATQGAGAGDAGGPAGAGPGVVAPATTDAQRITLEKALGDTENRLKDYHAEGKNAVETVSNAASINDLLGRVRMGWSANTVQEGARVLSAIGVPADSIKQFLGTDPSAGDALNKMFLNFSAGAVRGMGAREPGSVISMFAKAYPNLESQPHAAELMTNALRMQAQWKQDRANAAEQWALDQQKGMGRFGENYKGLLGFEDKFSNSNNPRDYWKAAAAMSNEPSIAWDNANAADKQRIYDLIPAGSTFRAGDGKLYRKPGQ
jgi:hypothetical protein